MRTQGFSWCARALGAAATLWVASPALAQPPEPAEPAPEPQPVEPLPPGPSDEDVESARNLFRLGNERFAAGDVAGALEAYEGAHAIVKAPTTGFKIGMSLAALGRLLEARTRLLEVTRMPVEPDEPEPYARARNNSDAMAKDVRDRIPTIAVSVTGAGDASVQVNIDGQLLPRKAAYLPRSLDPGAHEVLVAVDGRQIRRAVDLGERQRVVIDIQLPAGEGAAAAHVERGPDLLPLAYVGFSVAVSGIALGAITGVLSLEAASEAKEHCVDQICTPDAKPAIERSTTLAVISTTAFVVGGAGAVLGILGLVLGVGDDDTGQAWIAPHFGPEGIGVTVAF